VPAVVLRPTPESSPGRPGEAFFKLLLISFFAQALQMHSLHFSGRPSGSGISIERAEAGDKGTKTIIDKTQEWCVPD
jgi:hypothetical protein